jgi:hypothetical protein
LWDGGEAFRGEVGRWGGKILNRRSRRARRIEGGISGGRNFMFQITNKSQEPIFRFQRGGVRGTYAAVPEAGFWELLFGYWDLFGLLQRDNASIMPEGIPQSLS